MYYAMLASLNIRAVGSKSIIPAITIDKVENNCSAHASVNRRWKAMPTAALINKETAKKFFRLSYSLAINASGIEVSRKALLHPSITQRMVQLRQ